KVSAADFERSIEANRAALAASHIGARFAVFAYPLGGPVVATKKLAGRRFAACRGGGQTLNRGTIDLNLLKAYFLDKKSRSRVSEIAALIELNARAGGWLILATHDVAHDPSDYGCDPAYFASIVRLAAESGARVLPMTEVCLRLGIAT